MSSEAPCAIALSGGVAKGAFHAGVLKAFAELEIIPSAIVGTSAGALNGSFAAKLIAEDRFTPYWVDQAISNTWLHHTSVQSMWSTGANRDDSLQSMLNSRPLNVFSLRRLPTLLSPTNLRELLKLRFTSVFSGRHFHQHLEQGLKAPKKIHREVHFAASITSLSGFVETYASQPLIGYGGYVNFHLQTDQDQESIDDLFHSLRTVVQASCSFPGVFPPVQLMSRGKLDYFSDGGLTKNAPFGRAIKLDPRVRTIFMVSCMPVTQPTSGRLDNMLTIADQVYKITLNKDLANDYRKIQQINERIEILQEVLERDADGEYLENTHNHNLLRVAGFPSLEKFKHMRTVEVIFIEPTINLDGDPFAAMYRHDRQKLLRSYIQLGYEAGLKSGKDYLARCAAAAETDTEGCPDATA